MTAVTRPGRATLFLAGDVMTGRGIDQILPDPCDPVLYEGYMRSALGYVELAERAHGAVPRPVPFAYVWGELLDELGRRRPDARIVNLETAVTRADHPAPKGINYRMSPGNLGVLAAASVDCCALANNHVLDWGEAGLLETLDALGAAGMACAGAGRTAAAAAAPAVLPLPGGGRLLVFACAHGSSGVPPGWAAGPMRPGVNRLPSLSPGAAEGVAAAVAAVRRPNDLVMVSLHWGPNWGYDVEDEAVAFAHALVDRAGVHVVHGHSSHHARGVEVYRGRLILYGCGDLLNDYEGIGGYEAYRGDLAPGYFAELSLGDGTLAALDVVPFRSRRLRLERVPRIDLHWLGERLSREGWRFGTALVPADGALRLRWGGG